MREFLGTLSAMTLTWAWCAAWATYWGVML